MAIEGNASFGPNEFDYYPIGSGSEWYTKWMKAVPAQQGVKLHVSPEPRFAEIVARSVLPKVRELAIFHKVVRDLDRYKRHWETAQKGKFITIYTASMAQARQVVDAIDPELYDLRHYGGITRGYPPTTRGSGHTESEDPIGRSGLIFMRYFDDNSPDD